MFSFAFLFITLSDMGINQYSTKTLASQPQLLKSYFPNLLSAKILLNMAYPLIIVALGHWVMGFTQRELYFLFLLCLVHGGNQFVQFFRANFQAMQEFRIDGFASVVDKVVLLLLVWALFYVGLDIESFIYARVGTTLLTIVLFYIVISRLYGWLAPRFDARLVGRILRASFSFGLITILYSIHDKVDQVMLKELANEVETSLYAAAYRWMDAFSMYLWLVLTMFFARFAYHIKDPGEQSELLRAGQIVTALPLIFVCVFVFFYGEQLLWQQTNSSAVQLHIMSLSLKILFVAMCINALFMVYSTLLTSTGYVVFVNWLIVGAILVNIVLNFWLIPQYGALAAAFSTAVSLAIAGLAYVVYTHLRLPVQVPFLLLGKIVLAGLGLAVTFFVLSQTSLSWYINTLLAAALYGGLCVLLGLIPKDLLEMLKK